MNKYPVLLLVLLMASLPAVAATRPRVLTVRVTFYCAKCDPSKTTATGRAFHLPGVAVDRHYIPLGSRVYLPGIGWRIADDTGSKVRGRHVDVRLSSRGHCDRRGVQRSVRVKVLPPRKAKT